MTKIRIAITDDRKILRCRLIIQLIKLCNAEPVLIPCILNSKLAHGSSYTNKLVVKHLHKVQKILSTCDAILIPGNSKDIHPATYNEKIIHPETQKRLNEDLFNVRLQTELLMAKYAIFIRQIPLLGICGGFQVVNIMLGGSLIQHLPDRLKSSKINHIDPNIKFFSKTKKKEWEKDFSNHIINGTPSNIYPATHEMQVLPDSLLGKIYKKLDKNIDLHAIGELSIHHQGCLKENLGKGLIPIAFAPDGVIEAAELKNHPMCLITQFHLECNVSNIAKAVIENLIKVSRALSN